MASKRIKSLVQRVRNKTRSVSQGGKSYRVLDSLLAKRSGHDLKYQDTRKNLANAARRKRNSK